MVESSTERDVAQEIIGSEHARIAAIHQSDWAALERFLGDDLTYTHMSGLKQDKAEYVQDMKDSPRTYRPHDLAVRAFGDFALVNGMLDVDMHASADGRPPRSLHGRTLQAWSYRDGRWVLVAFQATAVPVS